MTHSLAQVIHPQPPRPHMGSIFPACSGMGPGRRSREDWLCPRNLRGRPRPFRRKFASSTCLVQSSGLGRLLFNNVQNRKDGTCHGYPDGSCIEFNICLNQAACRMAQASLKRESIRQSRSFVAANTIDFAGSRIRFTDILRLTLDAVCRATEGVRIDCLQWFQCGHGSASVGSSVEFREQGLVNATGRPRNQHPSP